jgi:hypothetical protein
MSIPSELPPTKVMLRYLKSKQGRRTTKYRPMSEQEILDAAGEYAAEFGLTPDESLYRYCQDRAVTNGTFAHFLEE